METPRYNSILEQSRNNFSVQKNIIETRIGELERKKVLMSIAEHNRKLYSAELIDSIQFYSIIGVRKQEIDDYDYTLTNINNEITALKQKLNIIDDVINHLE